MRSVEDPKLVYIRKESVVSEQLLHCVAAVGLPGELREHSECSSGFQRHFSNGCKQVFSAHRWAISGIAGVFLDPFYSPGTDYIAFANTYIADLIARADHQHEMEIIPVAPTVALRRHRQIHLRLDYGKRGQQLPKPFVRQYLREAELQA